jgi:hypothetical protein
MKSPGEEFALKIVVLLLEIEQVSFHVEAASESGEFS